MNPSLIGEIASQCWLDIPNHYPDVDLDVFVIMPNHVHGILLLTGATPFKTRLGRVLNAYKGAVTARVRAQGLVEGQIWQSRYHDHIIRDERSLQYIRKYVHYNPGLWEQDRFYRMSE